MKVLLNVTSLPQRSLVLIFALFFLASASKAQQSVRPGGPDVRLRIETDQPAYRIGDSIRVRLTLRNLSGDPVRFENANYVELATLKVYQAGREIRPTVQGVRGEGGGPTLTLKPGQEMTLLYGDSPPERTWLNLRDWGYEIDTPGRYTIVGYPALSGMMSDHNTVRSNEPTFTVTP